LAQILRKVGRTDDKNDSGKHNVESRISYRGGKRLQSKEIKEDQLEVSQILS